MLQVNRQGKFSHHRFFRLAAISQAGEKCKLYLLLDCHCLDGFDDLFAVYEGKAAMVVEPLFLVAEFVDSGDHFINQPFGC